MLVEARDVEEFEEDLPTRKAPRSQLRVRPGLDEEYSSDEIAKMTLLYEGTLSNIEEGEIVKSKVLRVTDTAVILDVGFKSEGAVPIDEFKDARSLKEGDEVEVFLEHQEDQRRRGGGPDGRGRLPPRQPDRAAARTQHRRALGPELRVQDHQAEQAAPQHRGEPSRAARSRAQDQARRPDEGAAGRPDAEGHREKHHRFRRLHRPRGRGRPA